MTFYWSDVKSVRKSLSPGFFPHKMTSGNRKVEAAWLFRSRSPVWLTFVWAKCNSYVTSNKLELFVPARKHKGEGRGVVRSKAIFLQYHNLRIHTHTRLGGVSQPSELVNLVGEAERSLKIMRTTFRTGNLHNASIDVNLSSENRGRGVSSFFCCAAFVVKQCYHIALSRARSHTGRENRTRWNWNNSKITNHSRNGISSSSCAVFSIEAQYNICVTIRQSVKSINLQRERVHNSTGWTWGERLFPRLRLSAIRNLQHILHTRRAR
jgi:hypothetical protein